MAGEESARPLVSVIIPAYNARHFLAECLESVRSQTYEPKEIIVVDDGSTDGTGDWLQQAFPDVHYIWQENSGACSAPRNTGARQASGQLFAFFDADDVMLPENLASHVGAYQNFRTAVASIANYQNFDHESGNPIGAIHFDTCKLLADFADARVGVGSFSLQGNRARTVLAQENFAIASGLVIKREAFEHLGGFDEELRASEDFDLVFRAARHGDLAIIPRIGFRRRMHPSNMSNESKRILSEKIRSRQNLLDQEDNPEVAELLRQQIGNFNFAVAMARGAFSRRERLMALKRSLGYARASRSAYLKACVNLLQ